MFNGKSFNEKFLLTRKYYDFVCAINCTCKLTCMCACMCVCNRMHLREQYALDNLGNQNFNIEKKQLEILLFYTFAPQMIIIWCMVPEIWSTTDNFLSFWTIFCPLPPMDPENQNFEKMKKHLKILSFYKCVP